MIRQILGILKRTLAKLILLPLWNTTSIFYQNFLVLLGSKMNVLPIWKQKEVKLAKAPAVVFFYTSELIRTASFALNSPIIHHHKVFVFFPPSEFWGPIQRNGFFAFQNLVNFIWIRQVLENLANGIYHYRGQFIKVWRRFQICILPPSGSPETNRINYHFRWHDGWGVDLKQN